MSNDIEHRAAFNLNNTTNMKTTIKPTKITTHKIACKVLGKDPKESTNIHDQLDDIADAINKSDDNFMADFNNPKQKKWRPYFIVDASGFRFSVSGVGRGRSYSDAGSRLCQYFRSEENADFFAKQHFILHKKCFYRQAPSITNYKSITSHEIACEVLDKDPNESKGVHDQLDDIAKAINKVDGDFKADYNNPNQPKWYPWFDASSGFRFSLSCFAYIGSGTVVGSRLCQRFRSEDASNYFGTQFQELHIKSFNA